MLTLKKRNKTGFPGKTNTVYYSTLLKYSTNVTSLAFSLKAFISLGVELDPVADETLVVSDILGLVDD